MTVEERRLALMHHFGGALALYEVFDRIAIGVVAMRPVASGFVLADFRPSRAITIVNFSGGLWLDGDLGVELSVPPISWAPIPNIQFDRT